MADIRLVKFQVVEFGREDEDLITARLLDENDLLVVTFDPRLVGVGETYRIEFGHDLVTATNNFAGAF